MAHYSSYSDYTKQEATKGANYIVKNVRMKLHKKPKGLKSSTIVIRTARTEGF